MNSTEQAGPCGSPLTEGLGLLPIGPHDHPDPHTMVWSESELRAIRCYAAQCLDKERAKWRELAQRVAHQGNARGLEGLAVRCTVSESGAVVSWEVNRGPNVRAKRGQTAAQEMEDGTK